METSVSPSSRIGFQVLKAGGVALPSKVPAQAQFGPYRRGLNNQQRFGCHLPNVAVVSDTFKIRENDIGTYLDLLTAQTLYQGTCRGSLELQDKQSLLVIRKIVQIIQAFVGCRIREFAKEERNPDP